jgi:hypothetical protein
MDISGVSIASSQIANTASNSPDAVGNQVLKKALDIQQESAAQLIESVPDPDSSLGHNVDIKV